MHHTSKLFYIVGASGAGKDTLINYVRIKCNGSNKLIFAHRYITREPLIGNENHIYLTHEEFISRRYGNLFAMHWGSHGQQYGIGIEINKWMENGFSVVVNGSRQYLPEAERAYPELSVILIDASPSIISSRLSLRGRENETEIMNRIKRTTEITTDLSFHSRISNDGTVEKAGDELMRIISA
jgi:ribose 1,5-bisphosphokinase